MTPEGIRTWRQSYGYSLRQAADLLGVSYGYLGKIERGDYRPSNDTRRAIALRALAHTTEQNKKGRTRAKAKRTPRK